ncbi:hypothetical protein F2P56_027683 [Juglans regia]|uniref:Agenet domain-containing protein n=1 Tax=Juglans regia TaxID=51240 RepID=A0A833TV95_JUGRE|nr:hypothetical protein F2P56_027683 [Juglans regia]
MLKPKVFPPSLSLSLTSNRFCLGLFGKAPNTTLLPIARHHRWQPAFTTSHRTLQLRRTAAHALMDNDEPVDLPFEVGQMTESRSFMKGFRGAWFQCKIKEIGLRKGQMGHQLEYVDFPDERIKWTQLYQKPNKSKELKKQLMVRPQFPRIYRESQMPDVSTILEVAVIVVDSWQVGHLVDWWTDGCHWSGRVVELLGDDKVKVELFPPPMGEGLSYEASCKDLRPSLDWTPECGWTVPIPLENGNVHSCARIIKPFNQEVPGNLMARNDDKGRKEVQAAARASLEGNTSSSSHISESLSQPPDGFERMAKRPWSISKDTRTSETNFELDMVDTGIGKTSGSDSVSSSHVRDAPTDTVGTAAGKGKNNDAGSSKKMKHGSISLNPMCSDTVEAAVMDLEELLNKIKWARAILEFGKPLSGTTQNPWKFLEHRASSSTPK